MKKAEGGVGAEWRERERGGGGGGRVHACQTTADSDRRE